MTQKLITLVNVADLFKTLTTKHYSNWKVALKLADAAKELNEKKDFYLEKERLLISSYAQKNEDGSYKFADNGNITFETAEKAIEFQKELVSLQSTEVEIFDPIELSIKDFKGEDDILSPSEIMSLSEFVHFVE